MLIKYSTISEGLFLDIVQSLHVVQIHFFGVLDFIYPKHPLGMVVSNFDHTSYLSPKRMEIDVL